MSCEVITEEVYYNCEAINELIGHCMPRILIAGRVPVRFKTVCAEFAVRYASYAPIIDITFSLTSGTACYGPALAPECGLAALGRGLVGVTKVAPDSIAARRI